MNFSAQHIKRWHDENANAPQQRILYSEVQEGDVIKGQWEAQRVEAVNHHRPYVTLALLGQETGSTSTVVRHESLTVEYTYHRQ